MASTCLMNFGEAAGCMPACEYTDVHLEISERFIKGDEEGARKLYRKLLPLLVMTTPFV